MSYHNPHRRATLPRRITRDRAAQTAVVRLLQSAHIYGVYGRLPSNCHPYLVHKQAGCWYVLSQWNDGLDGCTLRPSRLMLISKRNGKILSDGSAGDEG